MSVLAHALRDQGATVSGSDLQEFGGAGRPAGAGGGGHRGPPRR